MDLLVEPGTLLAAWPDLMDPNFKHSVLLMCEHNANGAYGLIVNRGTEFTTASLLPDHPKLGKLAFPVHLGGPVSPNTLQFVHVVPDRIPGGFPLTERLHLGGDLDALGEHVASDLVAARRDVRLFVGYAGWDGGQLEQELVTGSWLPAPLEEEVVFGEDGGATWKSVVRSIREAGGAMEDLPGDPSWN